MSRKARAVAAGAAALAAAVALAYAWAAYDAPGEEMPGGDAMMGAEQPGGPPADAGTAAGAGLSVVAESHLYAEIASKLLGDAGSVETLVPPGADVHEWEATPSAALALEGADVVVIGGLDAAPGVARAVETAVGPGTVVVNASAGLQLLYADGSPDSHVFHDPVMAVSQVFNVRDGLAAAAGPDGAEGIRERASEYAAALEGLDAEMREGLAECGSRTLVAPHGAYSYLGARYGIDVLRLPGSGHGHDHDHGGASAADIAHMVEDIREAGAAVVAADAGGPPGIAGVLAEEAGARLVYLDPLETEAGGAGYVDRMRGNLQALAEALGCQ